jgi:predicted amidohydrolase YtcJ
MYDAMYRDTGHTNPDCFLPDQRLSFEQALHLYTLGAAYAAGTEQQQGDIKKGWL